ncbi:MAG: hypothetical protein PHX68_00980 [Alphaproteobacteria bacterium]|nr:hypothetical protein [Alphaproteobacteria bacterium]
MFNLFQCLLSPLSVRVFLPFILVVEAGVLFLGATLLQLVLPLALDAALFLGILGLTLMGYAIAAANYAYNQSFKPASVFDNPLPPFELTDIKKVIFTGATNLLFVLTLLPTVAAGFAVLEMIKYLAPIAVDETKVMIIPLTLLIVGFAIIIGYGLASLYHYIQTLDPREALRFYRNMNTLRLTWERLFILGFWISLWVAAVWGMIHSGMTGKSIFVMLYGLYVIPTTIGQAVHWVRRSMET